METLVLEQRCFGSAFWSVGGQFGRNDADPFTLFVTAHPLVIVVGMMLFASRFEGVRLPYRMETIGAVICFVGAAITLMDTGSSQGDQTATLFGDLLAFGGAVFVVGYIVVGRILRTWSRFSSTLFQ